MYEKIIKDVLEDFPEEKDKMIVVADRDILFLMTIKDEEADEFGVFKIENLRACIVDEESGKKMYLSDSEAQEALKRFREYIEYLDDLGRKYGIRCISFDIIQD